MKNILLSIRPQYVAKILNGEKTIEIRKTMPKCDFPIDVYIYCSKGNKKDWHLIESVDFDDTGRQCWEGYEYDYYIGSKGYLNYCLEGKVVAKFTLNTVKEWHNYSWFEITEKGCVSDDELRNYSKGKASLYIWHIDNLVIFDKPKEISEFNHWVFYKNCEKCPYVKCHYDYVLCGQCCEIIPLTKAPQSWCYVETEE